MVNLKAQVLESDVFKDETSEFEDNFEIDNQEWINQGFNAIVLGRGPLGVYTSTTLIKKGIRILNIDSGNNLKDLKNNKIVNTNIIWKSEHDAPSLDKNASDVMWNGGCMSIPVNQLGKDKLKLPFNKADYLNYTYVHLLLNDSSVLIH